ncbi:hypothetical protein [uncultured Sphingomonas sp.]|uniref:hypothetical protein n=1 Tax=uncultured Sphingomonas sp. TaxID=158754 RepID=UPI0035CC7333
MSAKTSAARRRAFFAALAATGNQTLAAERAKVSRSWVSLHQSTDPAFRAEMEAAVLAAKARLDEAATVKPALRWRDQDGEELAVRGSRGRWTQVARARLKQWTPRVEAHFLAALRETCNVKAACKEVGLTQQSAYGHRKRWVEFARAWDVAIEDGYDRLSIALVASAGAMLGDTCFVPDVALGPISVDQAIQMLWLHRPRVCGIGNPPGRVAKEPTMDEVRKLVLRKVAIFERAQACERRMKGEG